MAQILLVVHSVVRWLVLLAGLVALGRVLAGAFRSRSWTPKDDRASRVYTTSLDVQLLIGVALYATSPITTAARHDMRAAMKSPEVRYFVVEHPLMMLLAVVLAHAGIVGIRRAMSDPQKFRRAAVWFAASFALLLCGIPWSRLVTR